MSRYLRLLALAALSPLLMGHGGGSGPPGAHRISTTSVTIIVAVNPTATKGDVDSVNNKPPNDITEFAKVGTFTLKSTNGMESKPREFKMPQNFAVFRGCDLNMTNLRFVYSRAKVNKLALWIDETILFDAFREVGVTIDANNMPVITSIAKQACVPAPQDNVLGGDGGDGMTYRKGQFYFEGTVQFMTPP